MKRVTKKKADALVKAGGTVTLKKTPVRKAAVTPQAKETPPPAPAPQSAPEGKLFNKEDIKWIMIEAMKIANSPSERKGSRLTVHRDSRGFIENIDVTPLVATDRKLN